MRWGGRLLVVLACVLLLFAVTSMFLGKADVFSFSLMIALLLFLFWAVWREKRHTRTR